MTITVDHYNTLGVIPSAEAIVIKAAYRALVNFYHPDKNSSQEAENKIREINIAYETLSNSIKRKQYDAILEQKTNNPDYSEFECRKPFEIESLEESWNTAISFYPKIDNYYNYLGEISWRLAFAYKLQLLEGKKFQDAEDIAKKMKEEYLVRYFGNDKGIRDYAEKLIIARELHLAFYINKIVKVMGKSVSIIAISENIRKDFPLLAEPVERKLLYHQIKDWNNLYSQFNTHNFIRSHGGIIKSSIFNEKVSLTIENEHFSFEKNSELCEYILERYKKEYT